MRSIISQTCVIATVLLLAAVVHAELVLIDNLDTRPLGNLVGATATTGGGGLWGVTNGTSTGNVLVQEQSAGSPNHWVNFASNSGGDGRGCLVYDIDNTIADGEKGVAFFRFYADTSRAVDVHIGIHASTGAMNGSGHRNTPQNYIIAGFRLFSDGAPAGRMNMVATRDATQVIHSGLMRAQWYNCWIEVDHAADTYNIYLSTADGSLGAPPAPGDQVVADRAFDTATTAALTGVFWCSQSYASQSGAGQRSTTQSSNFRIDEVYWDGDSGLASMTAQKPDPGHGTDDVAPEKVLSWLAPNSPAIAEVIAYDVYLDPNEFDVINREPSTLRSAAQTGTSYDPDPDMAFAKTYYWAVDTAVARVDDPNDPPTPVVQAGKLWSFVTKSPAPEVIGQPSDAIVAVGKPASFTVDVHSPYAAESYQWYTSDDRSSDTAADDVLISGATSATYEISNAVVTDEKYFYCVASNVYDSIVYAVKSNPAALAVKRKVAHWTLDALSNGQYADISGEGHHAVPKEPAAFVDGINPALTNNGVVVSTDGGWAAAGTWDPSEFSGQLTIAMWVNWAGQPEIPVYQGLIGKRSVYASNMRWQLEIGNNVASLLTFKSNINGVTSPVLPVGEWEHVAVTYDGTTATIYRNGTYANSGPVTLNDGLAANMMIGAVGQDPALADPVSILHGVLDDIQIYNYALDAVTIAYLNTDLTGRTVCANPRDPILAAYDLDGDCQIGLGDLADLAAHWLEGQLVPDVVARP
ncbi:MAG: immunoglobulin domain-containing protein [Phycisphaerae bacterium]|nr:immunoglobulin domain-containing protein [Phycisphaerae bacterium]